MRKVLGGLLLALAACTTVKPGEVGIKVNNYGSSRGVQDYPILTGRVFYNPFSETVYEFPTFMQNVVWTKSPSEGSKNDESITFGSTEGAQVHADIGVSISFEAEKVSHIFVEQRKPPEVIIDVFVRNKVRAAFNQVASTMKITDIYGPGKQTLIIGVTKVLRDSLEPRGYHFDNVSIIDMRVDDQVQKSINNALAQTQAAIAAENKVKQIQAEAEQTVAKARGDSAAAVIEASGRAEANNKMQRSLSAELIQYTIAQKWDGALPLYSGSGVPMISLPTKK